MTSLVKEVSIVKKNTVLLNIIIILIAIIICSFISCRDKENINRNTTNKNEIDEIILIDNICVCFSQNILRVVDNTIFFNNSSTQIRIGVNDIYHIFPNKNRLVYIKQQIKPNYGEYVLEFYNFFGENIAISETLTGAMNFIFIETTGHVLAGQTAALTRQNESYLYDLDGNLVNTLIHDYDIKQIDITEDEKYICFTANKMRPLNPGEIPFFPNWTYTPYNHTMIFDAYTGEFLTTHSTSENIINFCINGINYTISTSKPDLPG